MPVVLPSADPYNNRIQPPGYDPTVHPYPTTPNDPNDNGGMFSGFNTAIGNYARSIQPVGTAASIYTSNNGGPASQELEMRRRLLQSGRGIINLSNPQSPSNLAVWNANQQVYGANENVFNATGAQNAANRAVNANDLSNINMRQGNFERILAASNDINDKSAVAQYNEYLAGRDTRNRLFGAAPEQRIDISTQPGFVLPSGQVAAPVSNEQKVTREAGVQEQRAGFLSDILKNKASEAGLNVGDARLNASRVSAAASQTREQAQRAEDQAKYEDELLRNDAEVQKLPPFPGAVIWQDPETGASEWVTAKEKEQRQYDYASALEQERYGAKQTLQTQRAKQEAIQKRQEETGGSPLAALTPAQLLEQYNTNKIAPPGAAPRISPQDIEAELVRRYMGPPNYYTLEQARIAAQAIIQGELDKRGEAAAKAAKSATSSAPPPAPTVQPRGSR